MECGFESLLTDPWAPCLPSPKTRLVASAFQLQHGDTVQVKGKILPDAKDFVVNLGEDCDNLVLHFNPRFDHQKEVNTIVCNSKQYGVCGKEQREPGFPFEQGGNVQQEKGQGNMLEDSSQGPTYSSFMLIGS
ncbi:galectin-1-like isoform X2 [Rhineura floridana]|uniref:galectin-1-like isoform X2 n=1 Tax=Rhineura floridana TaxID=261503 RepID=UPI002AC894BC|nr:galectin-1-like isoform X2 [Rhineura floridana]